MRALFGFLRVFALLTPEPFPSRSVTFESQTIGNQLETTVGTYELLWVKFCGGSLALGHRPGKRLRKQLTAEGCTLVVSLLSDSESNAVSTPNRLRLPLHTAAPPDKSRDNEVTLALQRVRLELLNRGNVFIHCSAGLHRTGMIAYALCRFTGLDRQESISLIKELRELTSTELTESRIAWAERFANGENAE